MFEGEKAGNLIPIASRLSILHFLLLWLYSEDGIWIKRKEEVIKWHCYLQDLKLLDKRGTTKKRTTKIQNFHFRK